MGGLSILYEHYDAACLAMAPARWSAETARLFFSHPFSPFSYTLPARMISASADVFAGVAQRRGKPAWNVPAPMEIVDDRAFGRLIRFVPAGDAERPRVLLVAPLSGHYATLLRGTVTSLIDDYDVYVTDWNDAREVPLAAGPFDLDDYIDYLLGYLRLLGPNVHVVAVCQPVPAVLAAVALLSEDSDAAQPLTMTLIGGPVDPRANPTAPTKLAAQRPLEWFERELTARVPAWYPGAGRSVYPGFVQLGAFVAMNPGRHVDAHVQIFGDLVRGDGESAQRRRAFYDEYLSVMDIAAEFYLQTIDVVFQQAALANGTMRWRGHSVVPRAIRRTAMFTIEGELDDISAPGQTFAAHALCDGIPAEKRQHLLQRGVGHYGVFNGRRFRDEILPQIAAFIEAHAAE